MPKKVAVDNLTMGIEEGECFGFLGPNGYHNFTNPPKVSLSHRTRKYFETVMLYFTIFEKFHFKQNQRFQKPHRLSRMDLGQLKNVKIFCVIERGDD
jgi:hypothetical protein